jgi:beta-lactamase regulating signal transducer with metallopeptidase domain
VPAAVGRSEISVPSRFFATLESDEQLALLAHELGHLARRDPLWLAAASAMARLAFFQPLGRFALRRLRAATEQAADDFAVDVTRNPLALARALTTLTTLVVLLAGGASAAGSPVYERVRLLLEPRPRRKPLTRAGLLAAALVSTIALVAIAPGVSLSGVAAADQIPWRTPSKDEPNARMLEVRRFERRLRDSLPRLLR